MKPQTAKDGRLYEEGFFVFELDEPPDRPFVVRADGAIVPMDSDGRYRLRKAPTHIEIERCAGPFYALRPTYIMAQAAIRTLNRRILAAHVRMGGSAEPVEPGTIATVQLWATVAKVIEVHGDGSDEQEVLTIPALLGDGPLDRDVVRKVPAGEPK